jgi:uncharacterized protein involved in response to NO
MKSRVQESYFLSQPHQPFFLLGIINAILMMLLFGLAYKGIISININTTLFHVYTLAFLLFNNVFSGFLFTTFPRFNQANIVSKSYYTNIFYANTLGSVLFFIGIFSFEFFISLAMVMLLISQFFTVLKLYNIYKEGMAPDKSDSFWILIAQYFGLVGNFLFLITHELDFYTLLPSAVNITFYLYLIFLAFSVGQRMIPFFSHSWAQKDKYFVKIVFVLFILKSLFASMEFKIAEMLVDIILALYMLKEFLRWEFHPLQSPSILWVLHLALFWLPTAFGVSAMTLAAEIFLDTSFYFLNIHLLAIGFLTTVLIGFGTRVTLGHSGQPPHADKFTTNIFLFIQLVVLLRTLFSINVAFEWDMNFLFDMTFFAWIVLFVLWGARYGRVLIFGKRV